MAETIEALKNTSKVENGSVWAGVFAVKIQEDLLADDFTFEVLTRVLPLDSQAQIFNRKSFHDRCTILCNRLLQLFGCSIVTGLDYQALRFDRGSFGKPFLGNDRSIPFSMTTGEQCVAMSLVKGASTDEYQNIGIDIASTRNYGGNEELELFKEIFSDEEFKGLQRASDPCVIFTYLWSLKESYTKFTGTGLNTNLATIDFGAITVFPVNGASLDITLDNVPLVFYSRWFNSEIITTCIPKSISNDLNMGIPKLYNVPLSMLIDYFIKT
ncbi:hypothetical protein SEUBUCD646_0G01240 [Saccharomyces eubayanus]|uniref:holo-[acyl-carrier-protein] synthase n=1 Tax=Saccharomyces eubayanus TaxID=1080349 RepID=A0ABN8VVJ8_SACEU|nr:hypothetical protein SEUBUCD650_0G01250 [Saccharomyces eubayanus]CAI2012868.1 hypothetical protein SEUBUCD646_0G01240 [Saccharomyces eubayanus]